MGGGDEGGPIVSSSTSVNGGGGGDLAAVAPPAPPLSILEDAGSLFGFLPAPLCLSGRELGRRAAPTSWVSRAGPGAGARCQDRGRGPGRI